MLQIDGMHSKIKNKITDCDAPLRRQAQHMLAKWIAAVNIFAAKQAEFSITYLLSDEFSCKSHAIKYLYLEEIRLWVIFIEIILVLWKILVDWRTKRFRVSNCIVFTLLLVVSGKKLTLLFRQGEAQHRKRTFIRKSTNE